MGCFIHLGNALKKKNAHASGPGQLFKDYEWQERKINKDTWKYVLPKQMSMSKSSVSNAQEGTTSVLLLTFKDRKDFLGFIPCSYSLPFFTPFTIQPLPFT